MIGFGAVGIATIPALFNHIDDLTADKITIITADNRNESVAAEYGIRHIVNPITRENIDIVRNYLVSGDMMINLSVDVDSISLARITQDIGCLYIDTCIEPWPDMYLHENMEVRTNYYDRVKAMEFKEENAAKGIIGTALFSMGANPGVISLLVKRGIADMLGDEKIPDFNGKSGGKAWSKLAKKLGIKVIQIAEQDTQVSDIPFSPGVFMNSWSVDGFISEAIHQPAECGFGTHEKTTPAGGMKHSDMSSIPRLNTKSSLYFDKPGGEIWVKSWTPHGPFVGHMVTHNEAISIAEYMSLYTPDGILDYRPTVYYAYSPMKVANQAIDVMVSTGAEPREKKVLKGEEISSGFDELGALFITDSSAFWYGSRVATYDVNVPHNNATTMQVIGGIMAGIKWMTDNPVHGVVEADDIPLSYLDVAIPYLGKVYGEWATNWVAKPATTQLADFITSK